MINSLKHGPISLSPISNDVIVSQIELYALSIITITSTLKHIYDVFLFADDPLVCSISNPDFVIYSSVVSFYLPFVVTLLVYVRIYIFLRRRRKRITFRQASGEAPPGSTLPTAVRVTHAHDEVQVKNLGLKCLHAYS